jgi:hypothetical protein
MRGRLLATVLVFVACSRREVEKESPRPLPVHEVPDAPKPKPIECDGGLCNGACLDLSADPSNCGACNHSCEAGTCLVGMCVREIAWGDNARVLAPGPPCEIGKRLAVHCPATAAPPSGPLWGTDVYTSDSSVCVAALHAGRVTHGGGDVAFELYAGAPSYAASLQNGIKSNAWGAYGCSFRFVTTMGCESPTTACGGRCSNLTTDHDDCGACGSKCGPIESCRKGKCEPGLDAQSFTTASDRACSAAKPMYTYNCAPGTTPASVWGSGPYTSDSSICTAAVHAGKITHAGGGLVTIMMVPGGSAYVASTKNGVTTNAYGPWPCAYEVR